MNKCIVNGLTHIFAVNNFQMAAARQPYIIVSHPKFGQKRMPRHAWEALGVSTDGWSFVRNEDANDKTLPRNAVNVPVGKEEYIPAEVKSMSAVRNENTFVNPNNAEELQAALDRLNSKKNITDKPNLLPPVSIPVVSNPAGDPADFNKVPSPEKAEVKADKPKSEEKPKANKPGPKPKK